MLAQADDGGPATSRRYTHSGRVSSDLDVQSTGVRHHDHHPAGLTAPKSLGRLWRSARVVDDECWPAKGQCRKGFDRLLLAVRTAVGGVLLIAKGRAWAWLGSSGIQLVRRTAQSRPDQHVPPCSHRGRRAVAYNQWACLASGRDEGASHHWLVAAWEQVLLP